MLVALVSSIPAFAAKHEIDQASVRVDGGFPFKITKPGSYKLTSNLVVPANTDGIDILASDVTLDLNGFSIIGPLVCTGNDPATCPAATAGVGIKAGGDEGTPGPGDVKVFNGSVRGMGSNGIFLTGDGSLVQKVSAESNAGAGIIVAGSVIDSSAIGNGSTGILASIVRDSEAASNVKDGIILDGRGWRRDRRRLLPQWWTRDTGTERQCDRQHNDAEQGSWAICRLPKRHPQQHHRCQRLEH